MKILFNDKFAQNLATICGVALLSTTFVPSKAHAAEPPQNSNLDAGGDIGNGGHGDSVVPGVTAYAPMIIPVWCTRAKGMLQEALSYSNLYNSHLMRRKALVASIQQIQAAYRGGSVPLQPLTYSLLSRLLDMNLVFPSAETSGPTVDGTRGDEVAYIVLHHLVEAAIKVNELFDTQKYLPYYERYVSHPDAARPPVKPSGRPAFDFGPFYTSYVASARIVLGEFFQPAYSDAEYKNRGNVLKIMSNDLWELKAMLKIIDWVREDVRNDVFSRALECLTGRLDLIRQRLEGFLTKSASTPFNSVTMRFYVEQNLEGILGDLDGFVYQDGAGRCGPAKSKN